MLNFSKLFFTLAIYWTLSNASLLGGVLGDVLDTVGNVLVPGGINNTAENLKLCGVEMVNPTNSQLK